MRFSQIVKSGGDTHRLSILGTAFIAILVSLVLSLPAFAHQQKEGLTTVLFNPRTGNIEIMHRIYMHDAEHAVKELFSKKADILKDPDTQRLFAEYVAKNFGLYNELDHPFKLNKVGHEVEGRFFWIYQETEKPAEIGTIKVRHDVLRDLWPSQNNLINFEGKGKIKSLNFSDNISLLEVHF